MEEELFSNSNTDEQANITSVEEGKNKVSSGRKKKQIIDDSKVTEQDQIIENEQAPKTEEKKPSDNKKSFKEEKIDPSELLKGINVEELNVDDLRTEIRSREKKRNEILEKLKAINKDRNALKEKRNELNTSASESFQKVQELKKKRDEVNSEIKEIKATREGVLKELKQISNREKEIIEYFKSQNETGPKKGTLRRINKEIEELEWKLQTTPHLNRDEENHIMDRISELSTQLGAAESVEAVQKEFKELRKYKDSLKVTLDDNWNRLNELVKTSQDRHNRISELYDTGKSAKEEADKSHQQFILKINEAQDYRKQLRIIKAELDILYPKYKGIQEERKKEFAEQRSVKDVEIKDSKSQEIQKKLSNKKGLSMEEMKFLMENRLISLKKGENQ